MQVASLAGHSFVSNCNSDTLYHWCCYSGAKGGHGPLTFVLFSIVSMSWFTYAILSIMLWPPHLFTASNASALYPVN